MLRRVLMTALLGLAAFVAAVPAFAPTASAVCSPTTDPVACANVCTYNGTPGCIAGACAGLQGTDPNGSLHRYEACAAVGLGPDPYFCTDYRESHTSPPSMFTTSQCTTYSGGQVCHNYAYSPPTTYNQVCLP